MVVADAGNDVLNPRYTLGEGSLDGAFVTLEESDNGIPADC